MDKVIYRTNENIKTERKSPPLNPLLGNFFVQISLIGISILLFYNVYHSFEITMQKLEISKNAKKEVNELRIRNLRMSLELEDMKSNEYLEVQARDRLNLSGSNEYVFIIDPELLKNSKNIVATYIDETDQKPTEYAYKAWLKFFEEGI